jgi:hypothetical protein
MRRRDEGRLVAIGECWSCHRLFAFDPDLVPSVPIDPLTNRPPDMDPPDGDRAASAARAIRRPVCRACIRKANALSAAEGRPPIVVLPGAYADDDRDD